VHFCYVAHTLPVLLILFPMWFIQIDQKVSVHLMISCLTTWLNLTAWQPIARTRVTLGSHLCYLLSLILTRLTLTPSFIPHSNYVIMESDWKCLKYFCVFCTVLIRCTETFWSAGITQRWGKHRYVVTLCDIYLRVLGRRICLMKLNLVPCENVRDV
jgi:hypothetical protein